MGVTLGFGSEPQVLSEAVGRKTADALFAQGQAAAVLAAQSFHESAVRVESAQCDGSVTFPLEAVLDFCTAGGGGPQPAVNVVGVLYEFEDADSFGTDELLSKDRE